MDSQRTTLCQQDCRLTRYIHRYFAKFLAILALLCGLLQYYGRPISCWTPSQFAGSMVLYANSYCYFSDKYYDIPTEFIPEPGPKTPHVNRYKWTPYCLLLIAAVYLIPEVAANFLEKIFATDLDDIIRISRQSLSGREGSQESAIQQFVRVLQDRLDTEFKVKLRRRFLRLVPWMTPSLVCLVHLRKWAVIVIFTTGALVPLILINSFFGFPLNFEEQTTTDIEGVKNVTLFPKNFLCDFPITQFRSVQRYTVQCNVSGNEMFEKIAICVCFMIVVISTSSLGDVIRAMATPLCKGSRYKYVGRQLKFLTDSKCGQDSPVGEHFVDKYLKPDGVFLIASIDQNTSDHVVEQVLARLLEGYKRLVDENFHLMQPGKGENGFPNNHTNSNKMTYSRL